MSTKQISTIIERGAKHIGAVYLGDGEWAYRDEGTQRWYPADDHDLAELGRLLDHERANVRADAYSHWCAGHYCSGPSGEAFPEDWTPSAAKSEAEAIADARITAESDAEELFEENPDHCRAQRWDVSDPTGDSGTAADASGVAAEHRAAWVHEYDERYRATMRRLVGA